MGNSCCTKQEDLKPGARTKPKGNSTSSITRGSLVDPQEALRIQNRMSREEIEAQQSKALSFKDYKGFKHIDSIKTTYILGRELGKGSFGKVLLGQHLHTDMFVAIKVISKSKLKEVPVYGELMKNELEVLENTTHPHITRVFELLEDKKNYFVVMELVSGGNLLDRVIAAKKFSEADAAHVVNQILLALNYMHKKNIAHRDLKPENLLCQNDKDLTVKLTDFGFAVFFQPDQKMDLSLGSPLYMAPELAGEKQYDEKVDVWSTGVILYILLTGQPPFYGQDKDEIYTSIQVKQLEFSSSIWRNISEGAINFLKKCLIKDGSQRPSIE